MTALSGQGFRAAIVAACLLLAPGVQAAGINTNVALPVHKGGFIYRTQIRFLSASQDPSPAARDVEAYIIPNVLVYGITRNTTVFGILPYIFRSVDSIDAGEQKQSETSGFGDLTILVRQTIYSRDELQRTSRVGLIAGLEIPSGSEAFSSHGTNFTLGGVYTLQAGRHELDADLLYKVRTEARNLDPGDELRYDLAYELRVSPWLWPDRGTPAQLYLVLEANGRSGKKDVSDTGRIADSGGTVLFLSPGLQWVARRVIYEAAVQLPVVQNLNGDQLETDFIATAGIRVQF